MNLVGEGADDAGGVFDETIAQMCEVSLQYVTIVNVGLRWLKICFFFKINYEGLYLSYLSCSPATEY